MEPTRTGSFDDEMFHKLAESLAVNAISKGLSELYEQMYGAGIETEDLRDTINEFREKKIAESHDITKSNFGFNP